MTDPARAQSFADLISAVLTDWKKFWKFLLLVAISAAITVLVVKGILQSLPRGTKELKFGQGSIVFSQPMEDGEGYLIIVSPQGWQETGIPVVEGDRMKFDAGGRVNIDLAGLNVAIAARRAADARIGEGNDYSSRYTEAERREMRPEWPWTGPDGIALTSTLADPNRQKMSMFPAKGYGALLGAIREKGVVPSKEDAFFVGSSSTMLAKKSGELYFSVNDVVSNDKDFPNMFFLDNIGSFYVKITIAR